MRFEKGKHDDIEIVASIPASKLSWKREAILVWVQNSKSALKVIYGTTSKGRFKSFLLLNDIPLVKWHDNENNCPTCEQFLTAGYGMDKIDITTVEQIRECCTKVNILTDKDITPVRPLLELLEEGLYLISFIPHYPTDGEGNYFWHMSNEMKVYKSLHDSWLSNGIPAFMLPTQPLNKYDRNRVEYYREQIRKGTQLGGIAYYFGGYLSALLDGHHRATASFLEGIPLDCLTICKVDSIYCNRNGGNEVVSGLFMGGQTIDVSTVPSNIIESMSIKFHEKIKNELNCSDTDKYIDMITMGWENNVINKEYLENTKKFPTYKGLEAVERAGELSDERIEHLLKQANQIEEEDMTYVLLALVTLNDNRVFRVAKSIASSERWSSLWDIAYMFLATIRTQEVEEFFIDFLINDDKKRPEITKIVDDYFKEI